jgi:streptogramin lyase
MLIKSTLLSVIAVFIVFATSPSNSGDIISCDSFESCPDGGVPLTNALLALDARVDALEGKVGNRISKKQIALLQWYQDPGAAAVYDTLSGPWRVAFDGTSIWIANSGSGKVSKMNPVDGTRVDYDTLSGPWGVAFDGTSIWITNSGSGKVSKMNPGY